MIPVKEGKVRGKAQPRDFLAVQLESQHQDMIQRQSVSTSIAVHS